MLDHLPKALHHKRSHSRSSSLGVGVGIAMATSQLLNFVESEAWEWEAAPDIPDSRLKIARSVNLENIARTELAEAKERRSLGLDMRDSIGPGESWEEDAPEGNRKYLQELSTLRERDVKDGSRKRQGQETKIDDAVERNLNLQQDSLEHTGVNFTEHRAGSETEGRKSPINNAEEEQEDEKEEPKVSLALDAVERKIIMIYLNNDRPQESDHETSPVLHSELMSPEEEHEILIFKKEAENSRVTAIIERECLEDTRVEEFFDTES